VNSNFIVVKIGNKYVRALLDTGSSSTVLSKRFTRQHHLRQTSLGTSKPSLISANCTPLEVTSRVEFSINISGLIVPISAVVIRQANHDFILGTDFLQNNQVIVDLNRGLVSVAEDTIKTPLQSLSKRQDFATCIESTYIPAHTEAIVAFSCPQYHNNHLVMLEPLPGFQFKLFAAARSFNKCLKGQTVCRILNFNPFSLVLRKGTKIASVESVKSVASCSWYIPTQVTGDHSRTAQKPRCLEVLEEFHQEYGFKISPDLEQDKRRELLQLLCDYKEIFARSLTEIKRYPGYELEIELLSNRMVF